MAFPLCFVTDRLSLTPAFQDQELVMAAERSKCHVWIALYLLGCLRQFT